MDYIKLLGSTQLFKDMPADVTRKLATFAREVVFSAGQELFREGDEGDAMYVITYGTVRVIKKGKDGEPEDVAILGTGSAFGEMAVVNETHRRAATIVAQERTQALALDRRAMDAVMEQDYRFASHFYRALARGLARRVAITSMDAATYRHMWKTRLHRG